MNNIEISGYAVAPAKHVTTKSGKEMAEFRIGVNSGKKPDGSSDSFFLRVLCFGYAVPNAMTFGKGDFIIVNGQLKVEQYTTKDGNNGTSVTVLAREVYKAERHRIEQSNTGSSGGFGAGTWEQSTPFSGGSNAMNEEIPF